MVINILSNRSKWTFYFLSSVQFNFTIGGDFYFNDPNYISSWPIGKNTSISRSGHEEQISRWGIIMAKYGLTSRRSNSIMLKSLNDYFK